MTKRYLHSQDAFIIKGDSISRKTIENISYICDEYVYITNLKKNELNMDLLDKLSLCCELLIIEFQGILNNNNLEIKCKVRDFDSFKKIMGDKWSEKQVFIKLDSNTIGKLKFKLCEKSKRNQFKTF